MRGRRGERSPLRCVTPAFFPSWSRMIQPTFTFALWNCCTHMAQVDPRFVLTCLVLSNASCLRMSHSAWEIGGLTNPHTSVHSLEISPGSHTSSRVLSYCCSVLALRLKSLATMSTAFCAIAVRTANNTFKATVCFLATVLWQWSDIIVKLDLPFLGTRRNRTCVTAASKAHPLQ